MKTSLLKNYGLDCFWFTPPNKPLGGVHQNKTNINREIEWTLKKCEVPEL